MNQLHKVGVAILMILTMSSTVRAIDRAPAATDVERVHIFDLSGGHGRVFVIVRKDGDIASHRYVIEARPTCGVNTTKWRELPAMVVTAACHVDANNIHFEKDSNRIYFQVFKSAGNECQKTSMPFEFPLTQLCFLE